MSVPVPQLPGLLQWIRQATEEAPTSALYAILDGARAPNIHRLVLNCGLTQSCLYAGKLPPELVEVAPYLVQLRPGAPATEQLLAAGWGKSWGIFVQSPAHPDALRRHLRRFLKVKDASGKSLVFRYYDPRVLRVYLPTCTDDELDFLFGPVEQFFAESEDGGSMLAYARRPEDAPLDAPPLSILPTPLL